MKIAVTGATGQLGQLVIQELLRRNANTDIVALLRNPEKNVVFSQQGIETRHFDYNQTAENLATALLGVDRLLLISSSEIGQRTEQHQHVIQAAKLAGVKLLAYTSLLYATHSPLILAKEHIETEQLIQASGLTYVLLRNNWYSENYAIGLQAALEHGQIFGATHHGAISSASRLDYATAAAVVLSGTGHDNRIYELAGDNSYRLDDVAQWSSELSGKAVQYQDLSEQDFKNALLQQGLPEGFATILADADAGVAKGAMHSDRKDLSQLIGRASTPMKDTIKQQLML